MALRLAVPDPCLFTPDPMTMFLSHHLDPVFRPSAMSCATATLTLRAHLVLVATQGVKPYPFRYRPSVEVGAVRLFLPCTVAQTCVEALL